jgi:hypothetical protein
MRLDTKLVQVLEVLNATSIAITMRSLTDKHINRESRLDLLVDLGLVDWQEASDRSRELFTINARGRAVLARYQRNLEM